MKRNILIVDDDNDELMLFEEAIQNVLPADQFRCLYAANARQAFELITQSIPDYIFVDLNMPEVNGIEFLSTVRKKDFLKSTKIYLHSTGITDADCKQAMQAGASGCIKKVN